MSISVTVAGKSGTNVTATNGDVIAVTISPTGTPGGVGPATNISVGTVTTLNAGQNATVTSKLTDANLVLSFGLPRGADGTNGTNGVSGANGINGITPTFTVGNVATLAAGSNAAVTATTSNGGANVTLNFSLPAGANGAAGGVSSINGLTGAVQLAAGPNVTISSSNLTLTIDAKSGGLGNDAVDGGTYTGTILGGITFTTQPQSQTVSTSSTLTLAASANLPIRGQVLALGGNLFAASGNAANMARSADNGSTWATLSALSSTVTGDSDAKYSRGSLASNGTRTVLSWTGTSVRYSDSADLSSVSAVTYTNSDPPGPQTYVAYSATASRWVIAEGGTTVASYALALYSSSDGVTWTLRSTLDGGNPSAKILRVVSVNGVFVAMTSNPSDSYSRSADGVAWTSVGTPFSGGASADVASSGTRAVAISGTAVRWTADGTTWGSASLPVSCVRIEYGRGLFWADAGNSTDLCTSPDGVTWTLRAKPSATMLHGVAAAAGASVALATYGYSLSLTSFVHLTATFTGTAASANFTVSATAEGGASVSYQWQRSLDAGSTWANIANATSAALNLTGLTTANTAERYRAVASATGAATKNSQSATLTVTE